MILFGEISLPASSPRCSGGGAKGLRSDSNSSILACVVELAGLGARDRVIPWMFLFVVAMAV